MSSLPSLKELVPTCARDVWQTLGAMASEENEERLAFTMAGALFLASSKAGFYASRAGIDRTILFFKFLESVDARMRYDKTFTNLCGRFVNYVDTKLLTEDGMPNESAREPIRVLMEALNRASSEDERTKSRIVRAMLRVRDAMHLYVAFSYDWYKKMADIDDILEEKFGGATGPEAPRNGGNS
jgi:hypothetical protein